MTIARHLATIDRLCSEDFPLEHGGSFGSPGGPGYHLVELERSAGSGEGDDREREEQIEAWREGLAQRLADRWGEQGHMSLDGVFLRAQQGDEHIPEPWASLGAYVRNVYVWQAHGDGRWVALGISRPGVYREFSLLALVTEIDPP
ncbi:hypothetical protein OK006_10016 [Actinobacteria bacterium OK006]|uniref:hypothetical protein n=1 Tax=Streptomyces mirabilis TaxID=68239 RepID=UPI0006BAA54E|nr:hypothetical protein OK006_10016 [Actinobacteria bacterium OK006]